MCTHTHTHTDTRTHTRTHKLELKWIQFLFFPQYQVRLQLTAKCRFKGLLLPSFTLSNHSAASCHDGWGKNIICFDFLISIMISLSEQSLLILERAGVKQSTLKFVYMFLHIMIAQLFPLLNSLNAETWNLAVLYCQQLREVDTHQFAVSRVPVLFFFYKYIKLWNSTVPTISYSTQITLSLTCPHC